MNKPVPVDATGQSDGGGGCGSGSARGHAGLVGGLRVKNLPWHQLGAVQGSGSFGPNPRGLQPPDSVPAPPTPAWFRAAKRVNSVKTEAELRRSIQSKLAIGLNFKYLSFF